MALCNRKNEYRKDCKRREKVTATEEIDRAAEQTDLVDRLLDRDQAISIYKTVHSMAEPYKEVFLLRVLGELSFKEISHILGSLNHGRRSLFQSKDQSSRKEGGIYMNNVTCSIVEDLLPLYMDGCCSKDSQQAVVEHMKTCEKCRETYRHLQSDLPTIANETTDMRSEEIARSLSKRIKKRKAAAAVFAVIFFVFAMISLFFVGKAIMIMRGQGSQVSLGSLESAVNLSEGDFSCSAQDIGAYSFLPIQRESLLEPTLP